MRTQNQKNSNLFGGQKGGNKGKKKGKEIKERRLGGTRQGADG